MTAPSDSTVDGIGPIGRMSSTRVPSDRTFARWTVKAISPDAAARRPLGRGMGRGAVVPSSDGRHPRVSSACSVDMTPANFCGDAVNHDARLAVRAIVTRMGSPPETSAASSARWTMRSSPRDVPGASGGSGSGVGVGVASPVGRAVTVWSGAGAAEEIDGVAGALVQAARTRAAPTPTRAERPRAPAHVTATRGRLIPAAGVRRRAHSLCRLHAGGFPGVPRSCGASHTGCH